MSKGIKFRPEEYYEASHDKLKAAMALHTESEYPSSIYYFGVAIECMLRAFITLKDTEFDEKHVLPKLFTSSGIDRFMSDTNREKMGAAIGNAWQRWKNDYRYASRRKIEGLYRKINLHHHKGDYLKENSRILQESATLIIRKGMQQWQTKH